MQAIASTRSGHRGPYAYISGTELMLQGSGLLDAVLIVIR